MVQSNPGDIFLHGQFFGAALGRRSLPGLELALLRPTVPEHEVRTHTHAEAHLVLLINGRYLSTAQGAAAVCSGPTLIFNPAGTRHRDRFQGDTGQFMTLSITAAASQAFQVAARLPDHPRVLTGDGIVTAQRIAAALDASIDMPALTLESLCSELLAAAAAVDAEPKPPPPWLRRIRELLHDACGDELRLDQLAEAAGVHSVHVTRAFRRHYRCTPGEFLRRCRLNRAAALLGRRGRSLGDIAAVCGYFDQAHFSRSFKQAYGVTPRAYRDYMQVCQIQDSDAGVSLR